MCCAWQKELEADESASVVQYIQKLSGEEIKKLSENISPVSRCALCGTQRSYALVHLAQLSVV